MRIIRKFDERYCFDCIQKQTKFENDKNKKRLHV